MKDRWLAALLLLTAASASPVFAQGGAGSTGSIQGEVTDESGGVLPDLTVNVTGTSMMGARTDSKNASTRSQTNCGKGQLDSLPNARDMWSLLSTTPGIQLSRFDVGGNTAGTRQT